MSSFRLRINGVAHEVDSDPAMPLIFALRDRLGLTGAKLGCGLEQCGACAVIADGEKVLSCVRAISEFEGAEITTVEGLAGDGLGRRVQRAFAAQAAAQCGYCTPGIVVATTALLRENPAPDDAAVTEALHGHLCRCGSHNRVLKAIRGLIEEGAKNAC